MADVTMAELVTLWTAAKQRYTYVDSYVNKPADGAAEGLSYFDTTNGDVYVSNGATWDLEMDASVADPVKVTGSNTRKWVTATVTIGTGAAHSAGDVVSTDAGAIIQFECNTKLAAGESGVILSSLVTLDQDAVFSSGAGYTLYLFDESPTAQATNAAFDLADADLAKYIGKIDLGTLVDLTSNCAVNDIGHNFDFNLAAADTKLYGKLVCKGGETTVSGAVITINLGIAAL